MFTLIVSAMAFSHNALPVVKYPAPNVPGGCVVIQGDREKMKEKGTEPVRTITTKH